jgi:hypothetical protein
MMNSNEVYKTRYQKDKEVYWSNSQITDDDLSFMYCFFLTFVLRYYFTAILYYI